MAKFGVQKANGNPEPFAGLLGLNLVDSIGLG